MVRVQLRRKLSDGKQAELTAMTCIKSQCGHTASLRDAAEQLLVAVKGS